MTAWVMSIVAIVSLGVLLDILLPEGETNKYIKGIFSIITVFAIVSPITNLFVKDFDISKLFSKDNSIQINENYIKDITKDQQKQAENNILKILEKNGYSNAEVSIDFSMNTLKIESISINLKNVVINDENKHKNIVDNITQIIISATGVKKEQVRIYGYG